MNGRVRLSSIWMGRSTPSRWIILESTLIAVECAAIGAMLGWLLAGGTLGQVAVGGLAGLLIAGLIPCLTAVKAVPDSFAFAATCLILWLVLVLPLILIPFSVCWWLGVVCSPHRARVE
jgi:hypothetical protein